MTYPDQRESDFVIKDFRFGSGETLPELRQHFITIGTPQRDAAGQVTNAVLLIHNTTGTAKTWLEPTLAGELSQCRREAARCRAALRRDGGLHRLRPVEQAE